ncbi:MAG TPA: Lrp/AsnC ligand binding domain-containing protein [Nitrosopumilaceae archaeon]|nr:Lrp/AsnC ligand binding domain-containing protein [Nitrosopumilaceae archaeon]
MITAFVMISCELGKEKRIVDELKSLVPVKEVRETIGAYDIVVKMESNSESKIKETINSKIQNITNIRSTLTLLTS